MFEARLKSDSCCDWTYVLNRKNADECYGSYKLLQNTDFNLNVPANFKQNVNLVIRHDFSPSLAVFKKVLFCEMIIRPAVKRLEPKRDSFLVLNYRSSYHLAKWRFEQLVRAKKHEMTNFLFILHIILACSEQATHSLKNVTSDPSEYIFGASSGGIGRSRKIVGNWSFEARFLFDISVMMATMADGLKERENLYKLMIR